MSYYDATDMTIKTMAERCRDYYAPEKFVIVMNIDTQSFTYSIQRPENVQINQPSSVTKELYYLKDPDVVTLQPGQTRLVPAYEADHVIKQLVDKMVLRNRAKIIAEEGTPQESAMDPTTQHRYIQAIFQGEKDFMEDYNKQINAENTSRALVAEDLEDNEPVSQEAPRRPGRPAKQTA